MSTFLTGSIPKVCHRQNDTTSGISPARDAQLEWQAALTQILSILLDIQSRLSSQSKTNLTVQEVADLTGRSDYTVRRWISTGRLRAIRVQGDGPRGRLLIPRAELAGLIDQGLGGSVPDSTGK